MHPHPLTPRYSRHRISCLFLLFLFLGLVAGCQDAQVVDKTNRTAPEGDSIRAIAYAWADSVLNTMDDTAALRQVLMIQAPTPKDSNQLGAFIQIAKRCYGGILLPDSPGTLNPNPFKNLDDSIGLPSYFAIDLDSSWLRSQGLPQLIQLGATASDTIAKAWGNTIGAAVSDWGGNLVFLSAGRIVVGGNQELDALGADPKSVHQMSEHIVQSLRRQGIQPVLRPLPSVLSTINHVPAAYLPTRKTLSQRDLLPFHALAKSDSVFSQSNYFLAPKVDSMPAPYSNALVKMIRHQDEQLVFSPALQGTDSIGVAETALRCLQSGHDMVVLKSHSQSVEKTLLRWMQEGKLSTDTVRHHALRVLTAKALYHTKPRISKPNIPTNHALKALSQWITESSIVVLRDNHRLLPLKGGLSNINISILNLFANDAKPFADELSVYGSIHSATLDTTSKGRLTQREWALKNNLILIPLTGERSTLNDRGELRSDIRAHLIRLDSTKHLFVVNFGSPKLLNGLENLSGVIQAWETGATAQKSTAKLIVGAQAAQGKIPLQCGPMFCIGDGVARSGNLRLAYSIPEVVGADPLILSRVDQIVETAIRLGAFPGCQVLAAKGGQVFYHKAFGHHDYARSRATTLNDLYDIASVTKIAATTLMAMHTFERDTLHLDKPLRQYLPELDSSFITIKDITPQELMIHRAGLPPGLPIYNYCVINDCIPKVREKLYSDEQDSSHTVAITPKLYMNELYLDSLWLKVRRTPLDSTKEFKYSDMSMFLMQKVLERITGTTLNRYVDSVFYRPMGLKTICYIPTDRFPLERITPTENDRWWRNQLVHGSVHDPSAAMFGGVGGQAGLFSNAWDLAAIMHMLLSDGQYAGNHFLKPQTIQYFTNRQPNSHRGLGFDMQRTSPTPDEGMVAWSAHPSTFGHLGFTGTCAWADPVNDVIFVFLSNRVYPDSKNKRINELRVRQTVQQTIYEALGLVKLPEMVDCYYE